MSDLFSTTAREWYPTMVHRRSPTKLIERKFKQLLYSLSIYDRKEKETISKKALTVPALEVHELFGSQWEEKTTADVFEGEVLRDRFGRGTLQKS